MRAPASSRPPFAQGASLNIRLAVCLVGSLIVLAMDHRGALTAQRQPLQLLLEPIRQLAASPARLLNSVSDRLQDQTRLLAENQRLREEALQLRGQQLKFEALERENIRLRGLLDTTFKVGDQVLIVEPLAINIVPYENLIVVDKGSRHGVQQGQAVVDGNGVVGQVLRVSPLGADVVMITDPSHALPVQINRNGLRTLAVGTGEIDRLDLPYLPGNADVQPGDLLVTSGLGGGFPSGYPVARIEARSDPTDGAEKFRAVPLARLDRNRELLVVRSDSTPISRIPVASQDSAPIHATR